MLVWSVHGHGAVVTRNSWEEGQGGKSSQDQLKERELGSQGGAEEGPSQLGVSWLRRSTPA